MLESYAWLLWDIAAVAILAYSVNYCARVGLVRTLVSFVGYLLAAAAARAVSLPVADFLYNTVVRSLLKTAMGGMAEDMLEQVISQGEQLLGASSQLMPTILQRLWPQHSALSQSLLGEEGLEQLVDSLIDAALQSTVLSILQSVCFLILFSVFCGVVRSMVRMVRGIERIPIVGPLNTALGGVLGLLQGIVTLYLSAFVLGLLVLLSGEGLVWLNSRVMDQTFIWRMFFAF